MNNQTGLKRCYICQDEGDHVTQKCPKIVCANCELTGHAKKDCPNLLASSPSMKELEILEQPKSNPKVDGVNQRITNLMETLTRLEDAQRIFFDLSQNSSKYGQRLETILKKQSELNSLKSEFAHFPFENETASFFRKLELLEESVSLLYQKENPDFTQWNLRLVGPDKYFGTTENVVLPVAVETNNQFE